MRKSILSIILCLVLLIAGPSAAYAAEADQIERGDEEVRAGVGSGDLTRLRLDDVQKHVTGRGVNVAIIDYTGVDPYDSAIRSHVKGVYNSYTKSENWKDGYDPAASHGTNCAKHLLQVAPDVNLYIIRVSLIVYYESGTDKITKIVSTLPDAIRWAQSKKCRVISFSGSTYDEFDQEEYNAIQSAYTAANNSALLCASGGNTGKREYHWPASYTNTLCVGAATYNAGRYKVITGATYNDKMDVVAPVAPNGKTSSAAPVAAGTAALLFQARPSMTARECHNILRNTALDLGAKGKDDHYGYGLIQPYKALSKVKKLGGGKTVYAKSLKLSRTKLDLYIGQGARLNCTRIPSNSKDKVTWKSSSTSVVSVDQKGKVKAKNVGTAVITAKTARGVKATCTVDVYPTRVSSGQIKNTQNGRVLDGRLLSTWSRNAKAGGYIVQIATNKGFTQNLKEKKITSNRTLSYTFTGLKAGERYYWRIRTYKSAGGYTYYSGWISTNSPVLVR